jgi:hypothetical protein
VEKMSEGLGIAKKYSHEILEISNKLRDLENRRIYELSRATMDGYLATNIGQLREMLNELLDKIEYQKDSVNDELNDIF